MLLAISNQVRFFLVPTSTNMGNVGLRSYRCWSRGANEPLAVPLKRAFVCRGEGEEEFGKRALRRKLGSFIPRLLPSKGKCVHASQTPVVTNSFYFMKTEELRRCTEGRKLQRNTIASTEVDTNPASSPRNLPERNFENGKRKEFCFFNTNSP